MHRAIRNPMLVLELLLERHQPLTKRLSGKKPLALLQPIGTDDNGHILGGLARSPDLPAIDVVQVLSR